MAGDWVKMRCDLGDDPAVIGIASATGLDEDTVVGKLHRLWSWANKQTADGNADGVTEKWLDRFLSVSGFAQAMVSVGWLTLRDNGITIPNFDRHNSQSAKVRALTAKRVAACKARKGNAGSVTKPVPREEKRREENNTPPNPPKGEIEFPLVLNTPRFREYWSLWEQHRKEIRHALKDSTRKSQLGKLAQWGEEKAIAAIQQSVEQGWQGLFEPREEKGKPAPSAESTAERLEKTRRQMEERRRRDREGALNGEAIKEKLRQAGGGKLP